MEDPWLSVDEIAVYLGTFDLSTFCSGPPAKGFAAGPKRIGAESDAVGTDALVYHDALERRKPAYPYFAAEQDRIGG